LFPLFDLDDENQIVFCDLVKLLQTCSVFPEEKKIMLDFARDLALNNDNSSVLSKEANIFKEAQIVVTREAFTVKFLILPLYRS
jgi:hypothetical protein